MRSLMRRSPFPMALGDDDDSPVLPLPVFQQNPLAVLAGTDPPAATKIMHRMLNLEERQLTHQRDREHLATMRAISDGHTASIIEFIRSNVGKGHVAASVRNKGVVEDNTWFGRGQRVDLTTTFVGEAW